MSSLKKTVGAHIRAYRQAAKLTQAELAHKTGVEQSTVNRWESGRSLPDGDKFEELAKALGVHWARLFDVENAPVPVFQPTPMEALRIIEAALGAHAPEPAPPQLRAAEPSDNGPERLQAVQIPGLSALVQKLEKLGQRDAIKAIEFFGEYLAGKAGAIDEALEPVETARKPAQKKTR